MPFVMAGAYQRRRCYHSKPAAKKGPKKFTSKTKVGHTVTDKKLVVDFEAKITDDQVKAVQKEVASAFKATLASTQFCDQNMMNPGQWGGKWIEFGLDQFDKVC